MHRTIIYLFILLGLGTLQAHNLNLSSTFLAEQEDETWVLGIRASLTAFQYEIEYHNGGNAYSSPEEFQELTLKHVREHISLTVNNTDVAELTNGIVKLGHETQVLFKVSGVLEDLQSLQVVNTSFENISHNKSIFLIFKKGLGRNQYILTEENGHMTNIKLGDSNFELAYEDPGGVVDFTWIIGGILFILLVTFLVYRICKEEPYLANA